MNAQPAPVSRFTRRAFAGTGAARVPCRHAYDQDGHWAAPRHGGRAIGVDDYPDMVLEVDHTTDVRRGKLALYEAWGFPEVWVEVPDEPAPSRPRGRRPGLTIYLLEEGAYRATRESRAFPGWKAEDIHAAMNEPELSARTSTVLERVGTAFGKQEGTGPDHDPLLRSQRRAAERALLCRQAARKFDDDTARQLAALLEQADADSLAQAGTRIIRGHAPGQQPYSRVRDRSRAARPGIRKDRAPDVTRRSRLRSAAATSTRI